MGKAKFSLIDLLNTKSKENPNSEVSVSDNDFKVGRIEAVNKNLVSEFKEEFKNNNINFSTATELSKMTVMEQKEFYDQHKVRGSTSVKDVKEKSVRKIVNTPVQGANFAITDIERKNIESASNYIRKILKHLVARTPSMKSEIQECFKKLSVIEQYVPEVNGEKYKL